MRSGDENDGCEQDMEELHVPRGRCPSRTASVAMADDEDGINGLHAQSADDSKTQTADRASETATAKMATKKTTKKKKKKKTEQKTEDEERAELLGAVRPLVARVFAQFRDALEVLLRRHPGAPVSEAVGEQVFLSGLARQVLGVVAPTLFVELNAARASGVLRGDTVDAQFHNFLDDLDDESRAPALAWAVSGARTLAESGVDCAGGCAARVSSSFV